MEAIRVIARVASIFLFIGGLVVCATEVPELDKQLVVGCTGLGMILGSVLLCRITEEEEENVTG